MLLLSYGTAKCGSSYFLVSTVKQYVAVITDFTKKQCLFVSFPACVANLQRVALSMQFTEYSKSRCILILASKKILEQME